MSLLRRSLLLPAALAVLAATGACGPQPGSRTDPEDQVGARPTPRGTLSFAVDDGEGGEAQAQLVCSPGADRVTGYLRLERAPELCRRLGDVAGTLVSAPPADRVCAEVYGGPAQARVRGRLDGRRVDRRLSRTDACGVADWDRIGYLLPKGL